MPAQPKTVRNAQHRGGRVVWLAAVASAACGTMLAAAGEPPSAKDGEGFRPLFDGKTLDGWQVSDATPKSWKIENGVLMLTGGSSHLFTKEEFDDFIVRFEWRPLKKGYDSGFFVRGRQIQMAQGGAGALFGSKGAKAVPQLHKPPGEWNQWEVTCAGTQLSLKANGTLAWQIDDFPLARRPLGIQAEGHPIEFRNLWVKSLSPRSDK